MEVLIGFAILVLLIILGVPVVFAFGATVIYFAFLKGLSATPIFTTMYGNLVSVVLLAIPLFILVGGIMEKGGIGSVLVGFVENFTGRIKGSLCIVASVSCAVFGSICGSGAATLSCIGSILTPKMRERKYPMGVCAAVLCCAAPIGMLIPPSAIQILFAWAGNLSVLACFLATVIPGIILTILIAIVGWVLCRNNEEIVVTEKVTKEEWLVNMRQSTVRAIPALFMPILVLGGIYGGLMTPTEAAGVACVYAVIVSVYIYRAVKLRELKGVFLDTAVTTGVIMVMLAVIMVLSRILVQERVPDLILNALLSISENRYVILLLINIFLVIIGMIMDDVSGTLLCAPILVPIAIGLDVSPYQMAAILGVNLGMGNVTPPTAPFLYFSSRIVNVKTQEILVPSIIIIVFAYIPTVIITTYVPWVSLWLPSLILDM
ncbi:MAG: TRAP transporter large permease [Bacillota bacterium]|jgi:C4-dicarboxylate transporter DctM subunit